MQIQLDCECGTEISDLIRGDDAEVTFRTVCDECDTIYAVTITPLR